MRLRRLLLPLLALHGAGALTMLPAKLCGPLRPSARAIRVALIADEEGEAFEFEYDAATMDAIEKALEAQDRAAAEAKAAEIASAWARLDKRLPSSDETSTFDLRDESETATVDELKSTLAASLDDFSTELRTAAARALAVNRDALSADTVAPSSAQLRRSIEDDDRSAVDAAIREATRRLLGAPEAADGSDNFAEHPGEAALVARSAKYIARRVCSTRHVPADAAEAMRCALLGLAREAESYAWTASGGLL